MNIWVHQHAKKEAYFFKYIGFPAEFEIMTRRFIIEELSLDFDAYIFSSHSYDIDLIKFLLDKDKKVIFCIFHGDGVHLPNREELIGYKNFIVLSAARDGNPINILDFPNAHLNMVLPLAYFYVLFAVPLYDFKEIPFDKKYKCGLWHTPEYRHDRDHLIKELKNGVQSYDSLFKIVNQKTTEKFNILVDRELDASYKFWHCQYFNFLDCEMFLSFESANPYSVPYFCSDKVLKAFIMERLGIPTVQILHPVVMQELQNNGFYINGYTEYDMKVVNDILNSNVSELKQKCLEADNLGRLTDMIESGEIKNYLMNIIL